MAHALLPYSLPPTSCPGFRLDGWSSCRHLRPRSLRKSHIKDGKAEYIHIKPESLMPPGTAVAAPGCPTLDFGVKEHTPNWGKCLQASHLAAARRNLMLATVAGSATTPGSASSTLKQQQSDLPGSISNWERNHGFATSHGRMFKIIIPKWGRSSGTNPEVLK